MTVDNTLTPCRILEWALSHHSGKIAVVEGYRRLTYAQFGERVFRLAGALRKSNVCVGDRVAYLGYNSVALLDLYLAVPRIGAVLVPLNFRLGRSDLDYILGDCSPSVIVCDHGLLGLVAGLTGGMKVVVLDGTDGDYESWIGESHPLVSREPVPESSPCELFYTSGTTARPKGVELSHRALYLHSLNARVGLDYIDGDVQLHTIPLFHVNGWGTPQILPLIGGTQVLIDKFEPALVASLLLDEKITVMFLVPTMLISLLEYFGPDRRPSPFLRHVFVGGAAMSEALANRASDVLGCAIRAGYGMTETGPVLTAGEVSPQPARMTRAGRAIPGVDLIVADANYRPVARDDATVGEILVRSDHALTRYSNASMGDLVKDGWIHTGDLATWDETGSVRIVDRAKDMIISGGENISSVEVEAALTAHPDIFEVAVVGCPDKKWGEIVVAFLVLRSETTLPADLLDEFLCSRIAPFKRPRAYHFVSELPKGGTGKVQKKLLRDQLAV